MAGTGPYVKVLKDLERRRKDLSVELERLQTEYSELDTLILGIKKLVAAGDTQTSAVATAQAAPMANQPTSIKTMSMRWAILTIFGKADSVSMGVADVLDALTASGFPITDKTRGNISAVLSRMVTIGEVTNSGNSYAITERGLGALRAIQLKQSAPSSDGEQIELNTEGV